MSRHLAAYLYKDIPRLSYKMYVYIYICVVCVLCQAKHSEYECERQKAESVLHTYRVRVTEIEGVISSVEKKVCPLHPSPSASLSTAHSILVHNTFCIMHI